MLLNLVDGWVEQAVKIPSPNFNLRPAQPDNQISLLVIHNISLPPGEFKTGMVKALFTNNLPADAHPYFRQISQLRVSAHFLIERDGQLIQFVSCDHRAWHAGKSSFNGRDNCNDYSIGIELEGTDHIPYSEAQYDCLNSLISCLKRKYPAIENRICGHSDIAPGRKTDPGPAFCWQKIGLDVT